ncbi:MAG: imidazole glycerol phosphate synthase subunit HisH [Candidatus Omnitrophota bacterium]
MIAIVDYGLSNLKSVAAAVEKVGFSGVITGDSEDLRRAEKIILPGVGAFGDGMRNLKQRGLAEVLNELVLQARKPILGICLGAQLLCRESSEFGQHPGLGWLDASVVKLPPGDDLRVPHVGWNAVKQTRPCALFADVPDETLFYFVHSYYIQCADREIVAGECCYGIPFAAALQKGNIYATQFHPEKSQLFGLKVLRNFLERGN